MGGGGERTANTFYCTGFKGNNPFALTGCLEYIVVASIHGIVIKICMLICSSLPLKIFFLTVPISP